MLDRLERILRGLFEKKLKIGMITYNYPINKAVIAGPSVNTRNLAINLAKLGCEVHVFCSGERDRVLKQRFEKGKLIIHVLKVNTDFNSCNIAISDRLKWYTFETRVLNQVMYENSKRWFDIIHTQGWPSTGFMLKHFSNMNWIHTFRSLSKKRFKIQKKETRFVPIHDWIENTVLYADRIVCVSKRFREEVIKELKGIAKKTVYIYNGIDLEIFKPNKAKGSNNSVLFVGRFCKAKGVEFLPEVIETVLNKNKKYKFIMVANEDTGSAEMKEISDKLNELLKVYDKRFLWHKEPLTHEQLSKLHEEVGVYVQPSIYEPFGNTVLEAMATGKAIVITDVGGMPEIIGKAGLIAKLNSKDIAKKVLKLLENTKLRNKFSQQGIERAKEFEWTKIAQKNLDLYKQVIEENKQNQK